MKILEFCRENRLEFVEKCKIIQIWQRISIGQVKRKQPACKTLRVWTKWEILKNFKKISRFLISSACKKASGISRALHNSPLILHSILLLNIWDIQWQAYVAIQSYKSLHLLRLKIVNQFRLIKRIIPDAFHIMYQKIKWNEHLWALAKYWCWLKRGYFTWKILE